MVNLSAVDPVQLGPQSRFRFRCHPGVPCFTKCCSNIDIMLTPYDVVVMKKRLGLTSEEFLGRYTVTRPDEKAAFPFVYLRMNDDAGRTCPFVSSEGCGIYEDRPANCRYYPVGQGTLKKETDGRVVDEEFYFLVKEDHCKGYLEPREWSIAGWREDQGVDRYDAMNRDWKGIILTRNIPGNTLDENKQALFYLACYDTDGFRSFVFESRFFDVFDIEDSEKDRMRDDDGELMLFGFRFLKYILMMEETLKTKNNT